MSTADSIDAARRVLSDALGRHLFPAAVAEVGNSQTVLWREPFGTLTFDAGADETRDVTLFDLASLTKPLATTTLVLHHIAGGRMRLADRVADVIGEWLGPDRAATTIQDLLEHASGLPARLVDQPPGSRREFEHEIAAMPLEYPRRQRAIYSDLGFILLGFIVADRGGMPLDVQWRQLRDRELGAAAEPLGESLGFPLPTADRSRTAPTEPLAEDLRRGRRLIGDVHDNYAHALGGIAGHAGMFGSAGAVGTFARLALRGARGDVTVPPPFAPALMQLARRKSDVAGSSRALGWDTMLPTSSCGTRLSPDAFGHVGFTGTSLWIDPGLDRYFVLLTNRVCGGGTSDEMQGVRRAFHDAASSI